jgi:transporter family-2 protein
MNDKKDAMEKIIFSALLVALISGLAIGVQSSLNSAAGKIAGAALTGLLVNALAGAAAGLILVVVYARRGNATFSAIQPPTLGIILASGLLGIGIIAGIAYALPKIGVAAGLSMIITGQMAVGVLVDTFGLLGGQPISLNWARVGGLGLLALGTWALIPRG